MRPRPATTIAVLRRLAEATASVSSQTKESGGSERNVPSGRKPPRHATGASPGAPTAGDAEEDAVGSGAGAEDGGLGAAAAASAVAFADRETPRGVAVGAGSIRGEAGMEAGRFTGKSPVPSST